MSTQDIKLNAIEPVLSDLMTPVRAWLMDKVYWDDFSTDEGKLEQIYNASMTFEDVDSKGIMEFVLLLEGGSEGYPFYRPGNGATVYRARFKAATLEDLQTTGRNEIQKMLKAVKS